MELLEEKNLSPAGRGSWNLLLPKTWLRKVGLADGGKVEVYQEGESLIVKPVKEEEGQKK